MYPMSLRASFQSILNNTRRYCLRLHIDARDPIEFRLLCNANSFYSPHYRLLLNTSDGDTANLAVRGADKHIEQFATPHNVKELRDVIQIWIRKYQLPLSNGPPTASEANVLNVLNKQEDASGLKGLRNKNNQENSPIHHKIIVRGGCTGCLFGYPFGHTAAPLGIMMSKLNNIISFDSCKGIIIAEAGVLLSDLRTLARNYGWDLRVYPTRNRNSTLGGFLSSMPPYSYGSLQYGSLDLMSNIIALHIASLTLEAPIVRVTDQLAIKSILGSSRVLIVAVELVLCPAIFDCDVSVCSSSLEELWEIALNVSLSPDIQARDCAIFPTSIWSKVLNSPNRQSKHKLLHEKIPTISQINVTRPEDQDKLSQPLSDDIKTKSFCHSMLLNLAEPAITSLNSIIKGKNTSKFVYIEHAQGGFGQLRDHTWQQASNKFICFVSPKPYGQYIFELPNAKLSSVKRLMRLFTQAASEVSEKMEGEWHFQLVRNERELAVMAHVFIPFNAKTREESWKFQRYMLKHMRIWQKCQWIRRCWNPHAITRKEQIEYDGERYQREKNKIVREFDPYNMMSFDVI